MPMTGELERYLEKHGLREKLEQSLLPIFRAKSLPSNPFTGLVAMFSEFEILCKARLLFDEIDIDGSGTIDRNELYAKLKADGQLEELLGRKDIDGEGLAGAKAMGRVMVQLNTNTGGLGEGVGSISWPELEAAVQHAHLMVRAKAIFEKMDTDGSGSLEKAEVVAKLKADSELEVLLRREEVSATGGLAGVKAVGRVLVQLDTDAGLMGEGVGKIGWKEFEAAVVAAQKAK
mmetsp:Transcript_38140/g.76441  ORF Transcript_38140/g.76441 Transcript_38140/m.76441 type:complete len:232 (-) Transcript_38140:67-762(-)